MRHGKLRKKECINCKKITKNEKYCSNKCHKEFEWNIYKKKIEQKKEINSIRVAKKYLIETIGNKCSICGLEEWMGKSIVMITDHINGNPEDNSLKNLRLICPNCDSQTDTYKGKNKGNGRHTRRMRYLQGKSF